MATHPFDVLEFWWQAGPSRWFERDDAFDTACRERFLEVHKQASAGALAGWETEPHGALALILVLDQFSRNIFRDDPKSFAQDEAALGVAERALDRGFDRAYPVPAKNFFYLPFMHAENIAAQSRCVDLFRALGDQNAYLYALIHLDVIRRFGRFPHRNDILGRKTTDEERRYLQSGGFAG